MKRLFILPLFLLTLLFSPTPVQAQDSILHSQTITDSGKSVSRLSKLLQNNTWVNAKGSPEALQASRRTAPDKDELFYLIVSIALGIGMLKLGYSRYVENLFRVFFNSSLRQSQLTDQLLLAKLPSLFFNIIFFLIAGLYAYLLLNIYQHHDFQHGRYFLLLSLFIAGTYLVKTIVTKFLGWLTGFRSEASSYVFIVFLLNKIMGLFLLPMVMLIAFSDQVLLHSALFLSYVLIGGMFILRFVRSYALLQYRLQVSAFHFLLYLVGVELLPILLIYQVAVQFLAKSL